jgi:hypothetical protein
MNVPCPGTGKRCDQRSVQIGSMPQNVHQRAVYGEKFKFSPKTRENAKVIMLNNDLSCSHEVKKLLVLGSLANKQCWKTKQELKSFRLTRWIFASSSWRETKSFSRYLECVSFRGLAPAQLQSKVNESSRVLSLSSASALGCSLRLLPTRSSFFMFNRVTEVSWMNIR